MNVECSKLERESLNNLKYGLGPFASYSKRLSSCRYQDNFKNLKKACLWQAFFVSLGNEKKVTSYIKGN